MRLFVVSILSVLLSHEVFAHGAGHSDAAYYVGQQEVGIAGDVVPCYVEADFSQDGLTATVRSLVADSHDTEMLFGLGPVVAQYNKASTGYVYSNQDVGAIVIDLLLLTPQEQKAEKMNVKYLHVSHPHSLSCNALVELSGVDLEKVEEMFEHFDDYTGDHDHEGDHDEEGDHGHEDGDDHDHE